MTATRIGDSTRVGSARQLGDSPANVSAGIAEGTVSLWLTPSSEVSEIRVNPSLWGRGAQWGLGRQWGDDPPVITAAASDVTRVRILPPARWSHDLEEQRDEILGGGRQIGLEEEVEITAETVTRNRARIRPSLLEFGQAGLTPGLWGQGGQWGLGRQFGKDLVSVVSAASVTFHGDTPSARWTGEQTEVNEDLIGGGGQIGLDEPVVATASGPSVTRKILTAILDFDFEDLADGQWGQGYQWGYGRQMGLRTPTRGVATGLSTVGQRGSIGSIERIFIFWAVAAQFPIPAVEEIRTHESLELSLRAPKADVVEHLRPMFESAQGQIDLIVKEDGSFEARDSSTTGNEFTLSPPHPQRPTRQERDYLVEEYDETAIDDNNDEFEIDIEFVPAESREPLGESIEQEREHPDKEWIFEINNSTFVTKSVEKDISRSQDVVSITTVLKAEEVRVIEESASYLEAIQRRVIPDGDDVWVDHSPGERNTIHLTPPEPVDAVEAGEYRLVSWETRRINEIRYEMEMELAITEPDQIE